VALVSGLFGGGSTNVQPALAGNVYQPPNQGPMNNLYSSLVSQMGKIGQQDINRFLPGLQAQVPGAEQFANRSLGIANQYLNPPQTSPIYQNLADQARQQSAASNAASGVYGPYAANTTNQALNQLSLGWQTQMPGQAAGIAQGGQSVLGNAFGNINNLFGLPQQSASDALQYLNLGQNAAMNAITGGNIGFQQNQQQLGDIGGLFSSLLGGGVLGNTLFGGPLNFGGGGLFGSLFGGGETGGIDTSGFLPGDLSFLEGV
jgi:hypothetical protein